MVLDCAKDYIIFEDLSTIFCTIHSVIYFHKSKFQCIQSPLHSSSIFMSISIIDFISREKMLLDHFLPTCSWWTHAQKISFGFALEPWTIFAWSPAHKVKIFIGENESVVPWLFDWVLEAAYFDQNPHLHTFFTMAWEVLNYPLL